MVRVPYQQARVTMMSSQSSTVSTSIPPKRSGTWRLPLLPPCQPSPTQLCFLSLCGALHCFEQRPLSRSRKGETPRPAAFAAGVPILAGCLFWPLSDTMGGAGPRARADLRLCPSHPAPVTLSAPLTNHCLLPRCVMPLRRGLGDVHGLAFVGQWRSTPCRRRRGSRLSSSSTRSTGSRPPLASRRGRGARLGGLQAVVGGPGGSAVYGRGGGDAAAENPMAAAVPACLGDTAVSAPLQPITQ